MKGVPRIAATETNPVSLALRMEREKKHGRESTVGDACVDRKAMPGSTAAEIGAPASTIFTTLQMRARAGKGVA